MPSATSQQLLEEIAALQAAQTEFMKQLETLPPNSVEREKYLVGQINHVTQEKITKFRELYSSSDFLQQTVDANRDELNARAEILQLVEQQLAPVQKPKAVLFGPPGYKVCIGASIAPANILRVAARFRVLMCEQCSKRSMLGTSR